MRDFDRESSRSQRRRRRGFTLVEMLVTLALTMIMMYLFATIFQITGNFVTRQKGIGENDQSARILTTVLKTDLQARTMRFLAPFHPNMSALDDQNRQGYFYYSENNPMDDTDDVLQFTTSTTSLPLTNPLNNTQLYGLATNLPLPWQANTAYAAGAYVRPAGTTTSAQPTGFVYKNNGTAFTSSGTEPNWDGAGPYTDGSGTWTAVPSAIDQADGDDGLISYIIPPGSETINANPNNTGASQAAEVTYFLRHGNLIRRVLLIRNPYNLGTNTGSSQPLDTAGVSLIQGAYPPTGYVNTFWGDFDYSARINLGAAVGSPAVQFLATSSPELSLANISPGSLPIGRPDNRFGFDQVYNTPAPGTQTVNGAPREYALPYNSAANTIVGGATPTPVFFGRYTDEETSNTNFLFPGALPVIGGTATSPMGSGAVLGLDTTSYTMWLLNANPPTAELSFAGGARRGEDILLTNVISFDVKLWDAHYSEAPTGGITPPVDLNRNGLIDTAGGFVDVGFPNVIPGTPPKVLATGDFQQSNNAFPVYGPNLPGTYVVPAAGTYSWAPAYTYASASNGATYNYNNVFDTWYRTFDFDNLVRYYDSNDTASVYAPAPYRPRLGNPWTKNTAYAVGAQVDPVNTANGYVYKCTQAGTSATTPPVNQPDPFSLNDVVGTANATLDGTVQWTPQAPVNVQAIQITVKYLDPTQNLLRQVTIVQSLTL
jgi:competence protein ComGC